LRYHFIKGAIERFPRNHRWRTYFGDEWRRTDPPDAIVRLAD
jgi:hypothetical protein